LDSIPAITARTFLATVDRFIECQIDHEHMTVTHQGRVCRVTSYPISIEWPPRWLTGLARRPGRARTPSRPTVLPPMCALAWGLKRWDFTKGILERFLASSRCSTRKPKWRGRLTFLQVAAPSRSKLPTYQALQQQTLAEVARVNEKFGTDSWQRSSSSARIRSRRRSLSCIEPPIFAWSTASMTA